MENGNKPKASKAKLEANKRFRRKVQGNEDARHHRNKLNTLRSARNHIRNYSDEENLMELKVMIEDKLNELEIKR